VIICSPNTLCDTSTNITQLVLQKKLMAVCTWLFMLTQ